VLLYRFTKITACGSKTVGILTSLPLNFASLVLRDCVSLRLANKKSCIFTFQSNLQGLSVFSWQWIAVRKGDLLGRVSNKANSNFVVEQSCCTRKVCAKMESLKGSNYLAHCLSFP